MDLCRFCLLFQLVFSHGWLVQARTPEAEAGAAERSPVDEADNSESGSDSDNSSTRTQENNAASPRPASPFAQPGEPVHRDSPLRAIRRPAPTRRDVGFQTWAAALASDTGKCAQQEQFGYKAAVSNRLKVIPQAYTRCVAYDVRRPPPR